MKLLFRKQSIAAYGTLCFVARNTQRVCKVLPSKPACKNDLNIPFSILVPHYKVSKSTLLKNLFSSRSEDLLANGRAAGDLLRSLNINFSIVANF